jgi:cobyrinic acid a,c-diamide synthase
VATPSRHLGLIPVAERDAEAVDTVHALAGLAIDSLDLDAILRLAERAPSLDTPAWDPRHETGGSAVAGRPVVALAGGPAFTFSYAETTELLHAAGAEVVTFDPLTAPALPAGTRGVVIGGGFPEVHAARLAANEPLRKQLADFAADGGVIAAECAGLLYLAAALDGEPMCGVLDADARMTARLTLGYRQAEAATDSVLAAAGTAVRGHEFHRTAVEPAAGEHPAWRDSAGREHGWVQHHVHASYLHLHWAGNPAMARRFVAACA